MVRYSANDTTGAPELVIAVFDETQEWISTFSPSTGVVGTEVTLNGVNFTNVSEVLFSGIPATTFIVDSDTGMRAIVPPGATTGKVRVVTASGSGDSPEDFTVIVPPLVNSFSPSHGPVGTEVTILGTGLSGVTDVHFGGLNSAQFSVDSNTQLRAVVPTGASSGTVSLRNAAGGASSDSLFSITFFPGITALVPTLGVVGTEVTVVGANFAGTLAVGLNGAPVSNYTVDSDTQLRIVIPTAATSGKISVTNALGTGLSRKDFKVILPPEIASLAPVSSGVGTEVTILGSHFTGVSDVTFGDISAWNFELDSDTQLRAEVPAGALSGPIRVTNAAGTASSTTDFTVSILQSSLVFTPTHDTFVRSNEVLRNNGASSELRIRLASGDFDAYLKFNVTGITRPMQMAKLRLSVIDGGSQGGDLYLVSNHYRGTTTPWEELGLVWNNAPPLANGVLASIGAAALGSTVEIDVTPVVNGDGIYSFAISNASSDAVKYDSKEGAIAPELVIELDSQSIPSITSFSPPSGIVGTELTLAGLNFTGATEVSVANVPAANFTVDSDTELRLQIPSSVTTGKLRVVTPLGVGESANDFVVIHPPELSSFTPATGLVGTEVTILGSNLAALTDVLFDGISASSFTIDSDTKLRAVVPANTTTGRITLKNEAGTASSPTDFVVTAIPVISSISPSSGTTGTSVTLTGVNLTGTTTVLFNEIPDSSFTVRSDSALHAVVPPGATTGKIVVTNGDGKGESLDDFVVIYPPNVASFTPKQGPVGTEVTLLGNGFQTVSEVTFGGVPTVAYAVESEHTIRATVPKGAMHGLIDVTNLAGTGTSPDSFKVVAPPRITTFAPLSGPVGTEITVTGAHFTETLRVSFNDILASSISVVSDTILQVVVPSGATRGKIRASNADGTGESAVDFIPILPPTLASFDPISGLVGTEVTIVGSNFTPDSEVLFNGLP
ncbi:IPT/TIG domain-containing protein, partial [bacterium]|nr:IPT/TIG domain-containing protein [bacterium]